MARRTLFPRTPPLGTAQRATLVLAIAAGLLGGVVAFGRGDPVAYLAWITLIAPAAGALLGAGRVPFLPFGITVPALWTLVFVPLATLSSGTPGASETTVGRHLMAPFWASAFVAGLFGVGHFVGGLRPGRGTAVAGALLCLGLVLSGLPAQGGLASSAGPARKGGGARTSWARTHPRLAARLLELSPLVAAYDCARFDWVREHPDVYALSGVEWSPRHPRRAELAGPLVCVVGCALAVFARRRGRTWTEPS